MNEVTKALVQVAAALAVGCTSCLDQHVRKAVELGASHADLKEVLQLVRGVKLTATMKVDGVAETLFSEQTAELEVVSQGSSCGCSSGKC